MFGHLSYPPKALEEGLELEEIQEIEAATQNPVDIGVIDRKHMSKEDRLFVYAVASWMTRLDGRVSRDELEALAELGVALKVPEGPRAHADAIAQEVERRSEPHPTVILARDRVRIGLSINRGDAVTILRC